MSTTTANLLYLFTIAAFILALRFLSSPRHARLGVQIGAAGMLWAVIVTLSLEEVVTGYWWMAAGMAIGSVIGVVGALVLPTMINQPVTISPLAIAAALLVALGLGVGFGVYPASRAARLTPIDALRSE